MYATEDVCVSATLAATVAHATERETSSHYFTRSLFSLFTLFLRLNHNLIPLSKAFSCYQIHSAANSAPTVKCSTTLSRCSVLAPLSPLFTNVTAIHMCAKKAAAIVC